MKEHASGNWAERATNQHNRTIPHNNAQKSQDGPHPDAEHVELDGGKRVDSGNSDTLATRVCTQTVALPLWRWVVKVTTGDVRVGDVGVGEVVGGDCLLVVGTAVRGAGVKTEEE